MLKIEITAADPNSPEIAALLNELSIDLEQKTGRDGRSSFATQDVNAPRSSFVVAYGGDEPIGCGAIRPVSDDICEVKRMYARKRGLGIGSKILSALEEIAEQFGYRFIWLETGIENQQAIDFYLKHGYQVRGNFGKYHGRPECICFEKVLC
ncbi:MAG: GNAT family N-acetyltransferase [Proteobacteria bacterium]|nr:GNAT family N-acetyltransferase [Pseudomonadota bacterium]